ncbi:threonine aldolase family protein [Myroides odoratus]|uniref:threonine aldolase family protein n=1 Tax=Myroides odoratus TaxID=256 RepID=UPI00076609E9|nr:aminotransferase class I/II-fold pyridoxal phosphate-dependent enzyme [Myroides odoratus]
MYNLKIDYAEGAHPAILDKLLETNFIQQNGYGHDDYTLEAKAVLRQKMNHPSAEIYFVSGGTQANLLVISSLLRPYEAVISANTGHIYANETGAIEATGHKVIPIESKDGKITPNQIKQTVAGFQLRPHVVKPKLVYISNTTEVGTIYSERELKALSDCCRAEGLLLFMDGARLGHALTAPTNDLTLERIAELVDVFYIGATKNGALFGEAIVFPQPKLALDFDYSLKQRGALFAKGRVLGIQFLALFQDDLYFKLAKDANDMAMKLAQAFQEQGHTFLVEPASNQIFPILPVALIERLQEKFDFYVWKPINADYAAVRLITSWTTDELMLEVFISMLKE